MKNITKEILAGTTLLLSAAFFFSCSKSNDNPTLTVIVIDRDTRASIPNATVYLNQTVSTILDSALTDASGRAVLSIRQTNSYMYFSAYKAGWLRHRKGQGAFLYGSSRSDTAYLAKPSFVNLAIHRSNTYQPSDSVVVNCRLHYTETETTNSFLQQVYKAIANSPNIVVPLTALYTDRYYHPQINLQPIVTKLYFKTDIWRNAAVLSTADDSVSLIQFGTVNHTINY